jgi:hypothetical protein
MSRICFGNDGFTLVRYTARRILRRCPWTGGKDEAIHRLVDCHPKQKGENRGAKRSVLVESLTAVFNDDQPTVEQLVKTIRELPMGKVDVLIKTLVAYRDASYWS